MMRAYRHATRGLTRAMVRHAPELTGLLCLVGAALAVHEAARAHGSLILNAVFALDLLVAAMTLQGLVSFAALDGRDLDGLAERLWRRYAEGAIATALRIAEHHIEAGAHPDAIFQAVSSMLAAHLGVDRVEILPWPPGGDDDPGSGPGLEPDHVETLYDYARAGDESGFRDLARSLGVLPDDVDAMWATAVKSNGHAPGGA